MPRLGSRPAAAALLDELEGPAPRALLLPSVAAACEQILGDRLLHHLDPRTRGGLWTRIRYAQLDNGSWPDSRGRGSARETVLGWWAGRCMGLGPQEPAMKAARDALQALGGIGPSSRAEPLTLWMSLAGQAPPTVVPSRRRALTPASWRREANDRGRELEEIRRLLLRAKARVQLPELAELLSVAERQRSSSPSLDQIWERLPRGRRWPSRHYALPFPHGLQQGGQTLLQLRHEGLAWSSARTTTLALVTLRVLGASCDEATVLEGLHELQRSRAWFNGGIIQAEVPLPLSVELGLRLGASSENSGSQRWHAVLDEELSGGGWSIQRDRGRRLDLDETLEILELLSLARATRLSSAAVDRCARRAIDRLFAAQYKDGALGPDPGTASGIEHEELLEARDLRCARFVSRVAFAGRGAEDDRVGSALSYLQRAFDRRAYTWSVRTRAAVSSACAAALPPNHGLRRATEQLLRSRQLESGAFGTLEDSAFALRALLSIEGTQGPQQARLLRALRRMGPGSATDDDPRTCSGSSQSGCFLHLARPELGRDTTRALRELNLAALEIETISPPFTRGQGEGAAA